MFKFETSRTRRKPALTPLIDVVFLLLVFFMLASQFGRDGAVDLAGSNSGGTYTGPPRLVTILPDTIRVNGVDQTQSAVADLLFDLTDTTEDIIVLQARDGADVQRLTDVITMLTVAGFSRLVLAE